MVSQRKPKNKRYSVYQGNKLIYRLHIHCCDHRVNLWYRRPYKRSSSHRTAALLLTDRTTNATATIPIATIIHFMFSFWGATSICALSIMVAPLSSTSAVPISPVPVLYVSEGSYISTPLPCRTGTVTRKGSIWYLRLSVPLCV